MPALFNSRFRNHILSNVIQHFNDLIPRCICIEHFRPNLNIQLLAHTRKYTRKPHKTTDYHPNHMSPNRNAKDTGNPTTNHDRNPAETQLQPLCEPMNTNLMHPHGAGVTKPGEARTIGQ